MAKYWQIQCRELTLLVLIFAYFAVFDKVRENLFPRKMLFWEVLSFLSNLGDFAAVRWRIHENIYPRSMVISADDGTRTRNASVINRVL